MKWTGIRSGRPPQWWRKQNTNYQSAEVASYARMSRLCDAMAKKNGLQHTYRLLSDIMNVSVYQAPLFLLHKSCTLVAQVQVLTETYFVSLNDIYWARVMRLLLLGPNPKALPNKAPAAAIAIAMHATTAFFSRRRCACCVALKWARKRLNHTCWKSLQIIITLR